MITVDYGFHNLITDGSTPQILLLEECEEDGTPRGTFYLSNDGDMLTDTAVATFEEEMTSGGSYRLGCIPSRTMTTTLMNRDGYLDRHNFGWLRAFIGVRFYHEQVSFPTGTYVEKVYQGREQEWDGTYSARFSGFYKDGVLLFNEPVTSFMTFDDGIMYLFNGVTINGDVTVKALDLDTLEVTDASLPKFICEKMRIGKYADISTHSGLKFIEIKDGYEDAYYLCDMGSFCVNRPKKTLGFTVEITDAFDAIRKLDTDIAPVIDGSDISDGKALILAICEACGLSVAYSSSEIESRLESVFVDVKDLLNNSYSCRKIASYLCEAVGCNARLNEGALYIYTPSGETEAKEFVIHEDRIVLNGLEVQEESTRAVEAIAVKALSGETQLYPLYGSDNVYEIYGNPFVLEATPTLLSYAMQIPTYEPLTVDVLEADPSFQCGDIVVVSVRGDETELETNTVDARTLEPNVITTYASEDIVVVPSLGKHVFPIMSQTVTWSGNTYATYEAKGADSRDSGMLNDYTDTNARSSKYISADYISGGTIRGINIIGTHITGESTVAGAEIIGSKITGGQSITYYGDDYSDADIQRIGAIIMGQVTPTAEDYERLDVNKDGEFNIVDIAIIQDAMRDGTCVVDLTLTIDPNRTSDQIIKLGDTTIGVDSMKTTRLNVLGEATVGSLSAGGGVYGSSFTVSGHTTPIGSILSNTLSSAMSIPAQTDAATEVLSLDVPAGTWIMYGSARFAARTTAARQLATISTTSAHYASAYRADTYSIAGEMSQVQCIAIVTPTALTTYYLNVSSTVATSAAATATAIRAIRIL